MSITQRHIDQTYSDLSSTYGGVKEDYFALLYLEFDLVVRQNPISRDNTLADAILSACKP